jgi:uncharacterized NAD(P)/FAD-binding protein YdhS
MPSSIAFVGSGPTTIYTLCAFLNQVTHPAEVTIYEEQQRAGLGTPYRPGWNDPAMLSNIASIEIPPIEEMLIEWLERQPRARLVRLGIDPDRLDDHAFYPRLALGEYFLDQFNALIARARQCDVSVEVATNCRVTDIVAESSALRLSIAPRNGPPSERTFDQVVIATGHQWPEEPEVRPGYFLSPWPATALQRIPPTDIGIRGSSLTAIDAAVALAAAHGSFIETDEDAIDYRINPGAETLRMTMMSRKGLLPEADFHHPVPYEPLEICTPEAVMRLIDEAGDTLLDSAYTLFKEELAHADPDYAAMSDWLMSGWKLLGPAISPIALQPIRLHGRRPTSPKHALITPEASPSHGAMRSCACTRYWPLSFRISTPTRWTGSAAI